MSENELMHYGVKGMKWGVRRGEIAKAYAKASKKADKLHEKVDKAQAKSIKKSAKYDKVMTSRLASTKKKMKALSKSTQAAASYRKKVRKANDWYKAMEETFANTDVKMTAEQVARGKQYLNDLNMDAFLR